MGRQRRPGNWSALGAALKDARHRAGHTNGQTFAQEAGVAQTSLYNLENGRSVAEGTIIKVADALGWPPGRWREILYSTQEGSDEISSEMIIDIPADEWARLSDDDRQRIRDLVHRLANED